MGIKGTEVGRENDFNGLLFINRFRWLRPQELELFLWPDSEHRIKYAERIFRKWLDAGYVLARQLPGHNGTGYVLAAAGVSLLAEYGIKSRTGKDWGETHKSVWRPPLSWRHELRVSGVLALMSTRGHEIFPDQQLKSENPGVRKLPDGLIKTGKGAVFWLEVERANKSGNALDAMVEAMANAATGRAPVLSDVKATHAALAVNPGELNGSSGHALNHLERFKEAAKSRITHDFAVTVLQLGMKGEGVASFERSTLLVQADDVSRKVHLMRPDWVDERGGERVCVRPGFEFVMKQDGEAWAWAVYDTKDSRQRWEQSGPAPRKRIGAGRAATSAEAQRQCASHWDTSA